MDNEMNSTPTIEQGSNIISKSVALTKMFTFPDASCLYQNTNTIKIQQIGQQAPKLVISNFLCKQQGNKLSKLTEVKFGAKTFLIEDQFFIQKKASHIIQQAINKNIVSESMVVHSMQSGEQNQKKIKNHKKQLFKKRRKFQLSNLSKQRRDTKNVVKNFVKAFYKIFDEEKKEPYLRLKNMVQSKIFNNNTIQNIIEDSQLCSQFEYFLQNQAQQWVQISRVRDKNVHRQAIQIYLNFVKQYKNGSSQANENKETQEKSSESKENKEQQIYKEQ